MNMNIEVISNILKFNSELMELNIKYSEKIARLKRRIEYTNYLQVDDSDKLFRYLDELMYIIDGDKND